MEPTIDQIGFSVCLKEELASEVDYGAGWTVPGFPFPPKPCT